jgi:hypothetical protein
MTYDLTCEQWNKKLEEYLEKKENDTFKKKAGAPMRPVSERLIW